MTSIPTVLFAGVSTFIALLGTGLAFEARIPVSDVKQSLDTLHESPAGKIEVNDKQVDTKSITNTLKSTNTSRPTPPDCSMGIGCLTDGWQVFDYSLSWESAVKLGIITGGLEGAGNKKIFIHDFMFYKSDFDQADNRIVWGAGIRLIIRARELNASAKFTSLPAIAASAEFSYSEASYNIQTVGLSGPKIGIAAPKVGSYNIESYVNLMNAVNDIQRAALDLTTVVKPQLIQLNVQDGSYYIENIARTLALFRIASGTSCEDTKSTLSTNHESRAYDVITQVYNDMAGKCDQRPVTDQLLNMTIKRYFSLAGGELNGH
jgi:hypothetical protein